MNFQGKKTNLTRRNILTIASATLMIGLTNHPALADGGGGAAADKKPSKKKQSSVPKKLDKTKPILITQKKFSKLSKRGLRTLIKQIDSGKDARVEGFSIKMSRNLFDTALISMDYTNDLIVQMSATKGNRARRKVIKDHIEDLDTFESLVLQNDIDRKTFTGLFFQDDGSKNRSKVKGYLWFWQRNPAEGTLKS